MIERTNRNGVVFVSADGQHFEPLGEVKDIELSVTPSTFEKEYYCIWDRECTVTVGSDMKINRGFILYLKTGKKLFLKCPKKLKRSRKWRELIR